MKILIIIGSLLVIVVLFYFFFPALSAIQSLLLSKTSTLSTGSNLIITETTTPYQVWNTGMDRVRTQYKVNFKGSELKSESLKDLINAKLPNSVTFPTVYDAVEISADDILMIVSRDSQANGYLVVRLTAKNNIQEVDIIDIGPGGSAYNWFPDSRVPGWIRIVGSSEHQYMIQLSPFKKIDIGPGELAKVEFPLAYIVDDSDKNGKIFFRAYDLEQDKKIAELELKNDCFQLPRFSFNHPQLDREDNLQDDDHVKYKYGPTWWDKNIEFTNGASPKLKLKKDHVLIAPPSETLAIYHNATEIDRIMLLKKDCSIENPIGTEKSKNKSLSPKQVTPVNFCLGNEWSQSADLKKKVCGKLTKKKVFSKNTVTVNELTFNYQPQDMNKKSVLISTPELEVKGKKYLYFTDADSTVQSSIKEYFILNESQVLFKARSEGPWNLYLVTANENTHSLQKIADFAYPGSNFEVTRDNEFLYAIKSGTVIRKNPFGHVERLLNLITTYQKMAVVFYISDDGLLNLTTISLAGAYPDEIRWEQKELWNGKISQKCFSEIPSSQMLLSKREEWFNHHFSISQNGAILMKNHSANKDCVLK